MFTKHYILPDTKMMTIEAGVIASIRRKGYRVFGVLVVEIFLAESDGVGWGCILTIGIILTMKWRG